MGMSEVNRLSSVREHRISPKAFTLMSIFALILAKVGLRNQRMNVGTSQQIVRTLSPGEGRNVQRATSSVRESQTDPDLKAIEGMLATIPPHDESRGTSSKVGAEQRKKLERLVSAVLQIQQTLGEDMVSGAELKVFTNNLAYCVSNLKDLGEEGLQTLEEAFVALSNILGDRVNIGEATASDLAFFDHFDVEGIAGTQGEETPELSDLILDQRALATYLANFRLDGSRMDTVSKRDIAVRISTETDGALDSMEAVREFLEANAPKRVGPAKPLLPRNHHAIAGLPRRKLSLREHGAVLKDGFDDELGLEDHLHVDGVMADNAALVAAVRKRFHELYGDGQPDQMAKLYDIHEDVDNVDLGSSDDSTAPSKKSIGKHAPGHTRGVKDLLRRDVSDPDRSYNHAWEQLRAGENAVSGSTNLPTIRKPGSTHPESFAKKAERVFWQASLKIVDFDQTFKS